MNFSTRCDAHNKILSLYICKILQTWKLTKSFDHIMMTSSNNKEKGKF